MSDKVLHIRCVHCLNPFPPDEITTDHVIPDSWYPATITLKDRPTLPSCRRRNERLGNIERALLVRLGLCLDPLAP